MFEVRRQRPARWRAWVVSGGCQPARTTTSPQEAVVVAVVVRRANSNTMPLTYALAARLAIPFLDASHIMVISFAQDAHFAVNSGSPNAAR
jgi:hypothetical protein